MIPGKLYCVTGHPHPSESEHTGWGPGLSLRTGSFDKPNWITIDCGEIIMWLGLRREDGNDNVFTVLYKDRGVCMIDVVWNLKNLSKKLVLANTK